MLRKGQVWRHRHLYSVVGSGGSPPPPPPPPPPPATGTAFSYDILSDDTVVAPGTGTLLTLVPRGGWWPTSCTITFAANNAAFSNPTVTPTAGSTTPVTTTLTPSTTAEIAFSATNTGGLIDPSARRLNAFAASNGTAGIITTAVQLAYNPEWHHYAREIYIGNPTGWSTTWNKGWAPVQLTFQPAVNSAAVYARMYDADSSGASTTVGTGTLVQDWVQVYGAVLTGSHTITLMLPAGPDWWYVDLSLNSTGANPVRLNKRLSVGDHTYVVTRSAACGLGLPYQQSDSTTMPADLTVIVPYDKTATFVSGDNRYSVLGGDFNRQDGNVVGKPGR
jgi:hypothetical protein